MRLEDSIVINCPTKHLYDMVKDVERHTELLPGYKESRIVARKNNSCIVQREADMEGVRRRWKSEVWFEEGKCLHFRQVEGPLMGMHVMWLLEPQDRGTLMHIIHEINTKPRWKKWWTERWVYKPAIEKTARKVLVAIKEAVEQGRLS